ncbi:MAG: prepilin peptidase [Butyrivibrio sp.]|nr:prepilin peptidase [Butyrivibrio sp.]
MEIPILYCLVSGSALTDLLRQKIFNKWLITGACLGIVIAIFIPGPDLLWMKLMRVLITLLTLIPVYKVGGLGAGDIKLFMVIALFLSKEELIAAIVVAFAIGAVLGIIKMLVNKSFGQTIHFALPIMISVLLVTNTHNLLSF